MTLAKIFRLSGLGDGGGGGSGGVGVGKRGGGVIPVYTSRLTLLVHVNFQACELRPWQSPGGMRAALSPSPGVQW